MQMKRCDTHRRSSFYITHPLFATRNDKVLCLRLTAFVEGPVGVLSHTGPTADTFCCSECVFGFVCGRTWSLSIFLFFVCMQQYRGVKAVSICETHCICAFVQVLYSEWPLFCSSAAARLNRLRAPIWSSDRWELLEVPFTHSSLHSSTPQVSVATQGYSYKDDLSVTFFTHWIIRLVIRVLIPPYSLVCSPICQQGDLNKCRGVLALARIMPCW